MSENVVAAIMMLAKESAGGSGGMKAVMLSFQQVVGVGIDVEVHLLWFLMCLLCHVWK